MILKLRLPLFLAIGLLVAPGVVFAKTKAEKKRDKIMQMRAKVLETLYEQSPRYKKTIRNAEGYAVFSNIGVNLIFASFAGGAGVVEDDRGKRTFTKMGSAGLGLGLGVKDFRAIFIFHDAKKMNAFIEKGWDFSAQADAAAKSDEKGGQYAAAVNISEGVEVIQITENGLALQATLQGTKYWRDRDLNYTE